MPDKKIIINVIGGEEGILVSVQDFGIGISEEDQKKIFDIFYQSNDPSRPIRGLGLGLYIASEIIRLHKGKIWLESRKGEGSTFFFQLH